MKSTQKETGIDPVNKQIGLRIVQARLKFGITQTGLSYKLGMTHQALSAIEYGKNRASVELLYRISKILHHDMEFFLDGINIELETDPIPDQNAPKTLVYSQEEIIIEELRIALAHYLKLKRRVLKIDPDEVDAIIDDIN